MPMELACHYSLARKGLSDVVVSVRPPNLDGRLVDNSRRAYRVYSEFCPHGSLDDVINAHREKPSIRLPEPFIWSVAESLAEAGVAMANGDAPPHDGGACVLGPGQIVHRDMKPQNVFLDDREGATRYPDYPVPVLGEFGLAIKTPKDDALNPHAYKYCGTKGYRALDQLWFTDYATGSFIDEWPLGEHTNVYGLGITLWALIMYDRHPEQPYYLGSPEEDATLDIPANACSKELCHLVAGCLQYDYRHRPPFEEILASIRQYTRERRGDRDISQKMRSGTATREVKDANKLRYAADVYRVGLSRSRTAD